MTTKQQQKGVLTCAKQIIYSFSEKTPPKVKYSERNYLVAKAALAIDELIKHL